MSESPERIWIDRGPRGGWMKRFERMPDSEHEYIRTDLVQSQIDAAVAAERAACAEVAAYCLANPEGENLEDRQYAIKYRIISRSDTTALEAYRRQVRAEALMEAAEIAGHFYKKRQNTKPSDILALIPEKGEA